MQQLGVDEQVVREGKVLDELHILTPEGEILQQTDTALISRKYGLDNVAIERGKLLESLINSLRLPQIVHTGKTCSRFEQNDSGVKVWFEDGTTEEGIHSTSRNTLMPNVKPRYAGYTCWRAVVQTEPNLRGYNPNAFIETWGRKGRFGLVPLQDNRIYGFSYVNAKVKNSPLRNFTVQNLGEIFEGYHDPIPEILAQTSDNQLLQHDIYVLPPINRFVFGEHCFARWLILYHVILVIRRIKQKTNE